MPCHRGVSEPKVLSYFNTFNAGDFEATALLFADEGALHPPFENPIVGQEKIAAFLQSEAKGMRLHPREGIIEIVEDNQLKVLVSGKVQTSLFGVNVAWQFILNSNREIQYLRIKLLASPRNY